MTVPDTLRILSLDGGGMRGYLSACWLDKFVQQWGVQGNELWKHFDVIAGTSVGGIQALGYANGMSPSELKVFFTEDGPWIFAIRTALDTVCNLLKPDGGLCTASEASNRPNTTQKIAMILNGETFYSTERNPNGGVCSATCDTSNSNYGDLRLRKKLESIFGDNPISSLKTKTLITSYNVTTQTPVVFTNADLPGYVGFNQKIRDVAIATSAAPTYLPSIGLSDNDDRTGAGEYIDGGVYQNNPANLAFSLGKMLKPSAQKICLLSLGTGLGKYTFSQNSPLIAPESLSLVNPIQMLMDLLNISMTASQEAVDFSFRQQSSYTLDNFYYYRFQYKFPDGTDVELDNSTPEFTSMLKSKADQQFSDDIPNILSFIGHLDA